MEYLFLFFNSLLIGFLMSFALGPVFFSIINTSLTRGFVQAIWIIFGVILGDLLLILIAHSGISFLLRDFSDSRSWVTFFGGIGLVLIGLFSYFKKTKTSERETNTAYQNYILCLNGFVLNFFNPANFIAWSGFTIYLQSSTSQLLFVQYFACLLGIFITELAIAYFATKIKSFLTIRNISLINKLTSVLFVAIGIFLIYKFLVSNI